MSKNSQAFSRNIYFSKIQLEHVAHFTKTSIRKKINKIITIMFHNHIFCTFKYFKYYYYSLFLKNEPLQWLSNK